MNLSRDFTGNGTRNQNCRVHTGLHWTGRGLEGGREVGGVGILEEYCHLKVHERSSRAYLKVRCCNLSS